MTTEWKWFFAAFSVGWACGCLVMWGYFRYTRMLRTRKEWYADRMNNDVPVPDNWWCPVEDARTNPNRRW